jgi:cysteine synthase A
MTGAVFAAQEMVERNPDYFMPQQFENPNNPEMHRRTTALEILEATGGRIDAFVAAVGTGGTITGVGEVLKEKLSGLQVVAVEPSRSPVLQGGRAGITAIQGIGAGFAPGVLNREVYDEIISVGDEESITMSRRLCREEGLLVGISAGANVIAALKVAKRLGEGKRVVTVLCDTGERYLTMEA